MFIKLCDNVKLQLVIFRILLAITLPIVKVNSSGNSNINSNFYSSTSNSNGGGGGGDQQEYRQERCDGNGQQLKYLWGDALTDAPNCLGPNNMPYPSSQIKRAFSRRNTVGWAGLNLPGSSSRTGRSFSTIDPSLTRDALLKSYSMINDWEHFMADEDIKHRGGRNFRSGREYSDTSGRENTVCQPSTPSRLCKTRYNTSAPMYGVSLTSGQPVTIVQKFPDLLQQVVYEICETNECDVVRGECTQTYVPYLFLVIPLGPVTLTGQDYVLVESGCVCKPKYSSSSVGNTVSPQSGSDVSSSPILTSHNNHVKSLPPTV